MNKLLYIIVALVSLVCGVFIYQAINQPELPKTALYYQQPRTVEPFSLTSHTGDAFTKQELSGQWSWVFFGYTSCPDVCPTTLQKLNFVYDELKAVTPNTQVLLVSVDPNRDTVDKLSQYIGYFNNEFRALRGDHGALFPFARNLGLMYAIADDTSQKNYLVDHSASIVLINPQGEIAAIFKPQEVLGQIPTVDEDDLVADFQRIVALAAS
ncbi:SCO family protein [Thalassotalea euphylliae]|uniref:SCO family protein n=1 Tax=Thalassotalea euphylliae TaxID=1655234 RepID=A0A3E0UAV3_9GAMM|nr:SCO family protein [Thalassotalea euphylliae]REL34009.1 SCO family protein [Thalassotalea euphylliae]